MAVQDKDKLVSLEDLKTAYDDLDGDVSDVKNTLNMFVPDTTATVYDSSPLVAITLANGNRYRDIARSSGTGSNLGCRVGRTSDLKSKSKVILYINSSVDGGIDYICISNTSANWAPASLLYKITAPAIKTGNNFIVINSTDITTSGTGYYIIWIILSNTFGAAAYRFGYVLDEDSFVGYARYAEKAEVANAVGALSADDATKINASIMSPITLFANSRGVYDAETGKVTAASSAPFHGVVSSEFTSGHTYRFIFMVPSVSPPLTFGIIKNNYSSWYEQASVTISPGVTVYADLEWKAAYTDAEVVLSRTDPYYIVCYDVTDLSTYEKSQLTSLAIHGIILLHPSDCYTKSEVDALISTPKTADIIFWGDSLTAGVGGGGTTYCKVCADLLGLTFKNCGVGGENVNTIAARQGGNNMIVPAGAVNGTYALADLIDAYGVPINPLRQGSGGGTVTPVIINGQSCSLSITQENYADPNATYTISGYDGTLLFDSTALFSGYKVAGDITVIWAGTNRPEAQSVDEIISIIKSMLSRVGSKYVVLGVSAGDSSTRTSEEAKMLEAFGNHYFNTRKMLVEFGLDVQSITPTATDTSDIAIGKVPTSLRSDAVHLNADGYTAVGKMLASHIVGLGYAEYAS